MLLTGIVIFAVSLVVFWLCLPGSDGKMRRYLSGGLDLLAALGIVTGLCLSVVFILVGLAT